jgi:RNA-directed DNA polymerase
VRRVEIPKASGGVRLLGIPTVLDRLIQQAVMQALQADWDPTFSETSFGFRPNRSAHQAVERAQAYIASGYAVVVDIDLERFFDRVNHDILMGLVAKRVADKRLLKLIRSLLTAGVMQGGLVSQTEEGTPQGGPLSPLLSNLMLDVLDKELEKRGHHFVRYADDCNIYVRSQRAGERVLAGIEKFLEKRLRLKVNKAKSAVAKPRPQIPGLQLYRWKRTATAHRAAGARPLQGKGPGTDAAHVRTQPRADRQGTVRLPHRVARLLRLLPNPVGVA